MTDLEITRVESEKVSVKGDLTFACVSAKQLSCIDFTQSKRLTIDLTRVKNSDSAGLALMIEWVKLSKKQNVDLNFSHIPPQLLTLAKISGLKENRYFRL
ncbi:MAG: STAS domain-containing protein [Methylococcales bacterium]|nr:STAS domain-containing protein [Methylococcales bacterium]